MELYSQSMENYPDYIEQLTEDVLEDVTVGEDEVTGNISLDEDKYLVLSIPYQKGWTAYVDGEETVYGITAFCGRTQHPSDLCNPGSEVCNDYYAVCSWGICSAAACEMAEAQTQSKRLRCGK